jgi:hypothetical protein
LLLLPDVPLARTATVPTLGLTTALVLVVVAVWEILAPRRKHPS